MTTRRQSAVGLALLLGLGGCYRATPEPTPVPPTVGRGTAVPSLASPATTQPASKPVDVEAEKKEPSPANEPDALIAQAAQKMQNGDPEQAIRLLEQVLATGPDRRDALFLLAIANQDRANEMERPLSSPYYLRSAALIRKLHDTYKELNPQERASLPVYLYNEACTYAIQNQSDKALDALAESIDAGFDGFEGLINHDDELDSIRKLPRFAELSRRVEQIAVARAKDNAWKRVAGTIPFSFRFALPGVDGKTVTLDDVKGKVTIVDVWGTWCPPCRKEIPHYKALLAKYGSQGLAVVGINYEQVAEADVPKTIKAFIKQNEVPYPCLIGDDKTQEQIPDFQGFPTTLFLDRSGMVRAKVIGYHSLVELEALVKLLLDEDATNR